jgi:hypothetical protein
MDENGVLQNEDFLGVNTVGNHGITRLIFTLASWAIATGDYFSAEFIPLTKE